MNPDQILIEKCQKRDPKALEELYKTYSPLMYGVCLRYVKDREDARDLLHDGFIKVMDNLSSFRNTGSFEGWMRRIMVHVAINFYRRHIIRRNESDFSIADSLENDSVDVISQMSAQELMKHVQSLPDGYRMVFNLYVIEGYKHDEIGQLLGISENTSKSQLMKARRVLMSKIKENVYETV